MWYAIPVIGHNFIDTRMVRWTILLPAKDFGFGSSTYYCHDGWIEIEYYDITVELWKEE